jgi:hypothetical protein
MGSEEYIGVPATSRGSCCKPFCGRNNVRSKRHYCMFCGAGIGENPQPFSWGDIDVNSTDFKKWYREPILDSLVSSGHIYLLLIIPVCGLSPGAQAGAATAGRPVRVVDQRFLAAFDYCSKRIHPGRARYQLDHIQHAGMLHTIGRRLPDPDIADFAMDTHSGKEGAL